MNDVAGIHVRLRADLPDLDAVVQRLRTSAPSVDVRTDDLILIVRPTDPPRLAGMPTYYSGRPEYRGAIVAGSGGASYLAGSFTRPAGPLVLAALVAAFAAMGALAGILLVASGDVSGLIAIAFGAVMGTAIFGSLALQRSLTAKDERLIVAALRTLSEPA